MHRSPPIPSSPYPLLLWEGLGESLESRGVSNWLPRRGLLFRASVSDRGLGTYELSSSQDGTKAVSNFLLTRLPFLYPISLDPVKHATGGDVTVLRENMSIVVKRIRGNGGHRRQSSSDRKKPQPHSNARRRSHAQGNIIHQLPRFSRRRHCFLVRGGRPRRVPAGRGLGWGRHRKLPRQLPRDTEHRTVGHRRQRRRRRVRALSTGWSLERRTSSAGNSPAVQGSGKPISP